MNSAHTASRSNNPPRLPSVVTPVRLALDGSKRSQSARHSGGDGIRWPGSNADRPITQGSR